MTALAIARASGRRLLRDRTALFFLLVLPVVLIIIVGAVAHGSNTFKVGVLDLDSTSASRQLVSDLGRADGLSVVSYPTLPALERAVERSEVNAGVLIPPGLESDEHAGKVTTVGLLAEQANSIQQGAAARVTSVVEAYGGRVEAAEFASRFGGGYEVDLSRAGSLEATTAMVGLTSKVIKVSQTTLPAGYQYSAPTELVLFVFLSAVAGGATIVETRRLGMFERMSAAPVRARTIIAGESITYLAIALVQSGVIVTIGAVVFGVSWGNPLAAAVLIVLWALVGAAAGMVAGTLFRTPEQASAMGPVAGIAFAMLGGCMWPLSIVSPTMRAVGHATPHAWAVDAWTDLLSNHGDIVTIWHDLVVLAAFAAGLFAIATLRLRHTIRAEGR